MIVWTLLEIGGVTIVGVDQQYLIITNELCTIDDTGAYRLSRRLKEFKRLDHF